MIGASAALALSGIPFDGPIGAARVGYVDGQYLLNPTATELLTSQMDLVVAGTTAPCRWWNPKRNSCPKKSCWVR